MSSTLKMQFLTAGGDKVYINVSNPSSDLAQEDIEEVMDAIITKNIFTSKGGDLTNKIKADLVTTVSTSYDFE